MTNSNKKVAFVEIFNNTPIKVVVTNLDSAREIFGATMAGYGIIPVEENIQEGKFEGEGFSIFIIPVAGVFVSESDRADDEFNKMAALA